MSCSKFVLLPGGAGYIGSHTAVELLAGDEFVPVIVDNLANSGHEVIKRIERITHKQVLFYNVDLVADPSLSGLEDVFKKYEFLAVINFAGLKAVGESMSIPLQYYSCNLTIVFNLLNMMNKYNVHNFVFSSSACVYGNPQYFPVNEKHPVGSCANVYGKTKYFIEEIVRDYQNANQSFNAIILRYFNPVGAHQSGLIGEDPKGIPNNLMPYLSQVVSGIREKLMVFGNDYNTVDGTGVRDYIHVVDLAKGHIAALRVMDSGCGFRVYNLGSGRGHSVLQMLEGMKKASGRDIPYEIVDRRHGDIAEVYADSTLALKDLKWRAEKGLDEMCTDTVRWLTQNPKGYAS